MISPQDKQILSLHSKDKTIKEWIQPTNARKWHINENYFKTWSHNMAYVLGFWYANGCIYNGKLFDITQHIKDKYILKKIAKELEYEGPIIDYSDRQAARINFSCVVIYNDLIALGATENQNMTLTFPNIPDEYLHDFIRGYFDGNGSIWEIKGKRINSAFTCGSEKFLKQLHTILKDKAGVEGGSYDKSSYSLRFGKKDTNKIGNFIYKDNPELFLLRKRKKFNLYKEEN